MSIPFPKVPTRLNIPGAFPTDLPTTVSFLKALITELQTYVNIISTYTNTASGCDVLANRPAPAIAGRTYYTTDTMHFYVDNGTAWVLVV